jgi:hypothetical protein
VKAYWRITSGSLHGISYKPDWQSAFLDLVQRHQPRSLGELAQAFYICCSLRDHGSHFIAHYFDPTPCLAKAGRLKDLPCLPDCPR